MLFIIVLFLLSTPGLPFFGKQEGDVASLQDAQPLQCKATAANGDLVAADGSMLLSLVIPCFNAKDNVLDLLDRLYMQLDNRRNEFEVFLVDDSSSDGLTDALKSHNFVREQNFHFVQQCEQAGAGQARNRVISQLVGEFAYFLDADDDASIANLWAATELASEQDVDLMFVPYNISMPKKGVMTTLPMWPGDQKAWTQGLLMSGANAGTDADTKRKAAAFKLTNYPWIRIIRTAVLQSGRIWFGPTPVHNDVQYHWTSIASVAAQSIAFFDRPVCLHRKNPQMKQITNIATRDRLAVVDAVRLTDLMLQRCGRCHFYSDDGNAQFVGIWAEFVKNLVSWATKLVPKACKPLYSLRKAVLLDQLRNISPKKGASRSRGNSIYKKKGIAPEEAHPNSRTAKRRVAQAKCPIRTYTEADLPLVR